MKPPVGYRLILGVLVLFFLGVGCREIQTQPRASGGFLDLSAWDFERDGIIGLDGEWEFYWDRLLAPGDFNASNAPVKTGFFPIPGYWNGHRIKGHTLSGEGCATFRLQIKLAPGTKNLALRIEDQSSAYLIWVNGSPVMGNGVVAENATATVPYRRINTTFIPANGEYLDCIFQVSNFHLSQGGPYRRITLGAADEIQQGQDRLFTVDLLLFGLLGAIGVYHLVFYLLRRKDPSLLYFGLFCLLWCAGIPFGATGGRFITLILPDFPWYWVSRMELLTWFPIVPLFLMFFASLFPQEISSKFVRFSQIAAVVFIFFVLAVPSRMVGLTEIPYQIVTMVVGIVICLGLYRAVRNKRSEAGLMLAGFLIFLAAAINDILYMNMVIYSAYVLSLGIAVMILFQSFALAKRLARSFAEVEALTTMLEEKNIVLSQLDRFKDEFLANTSHELRTPLTGIVGIAESLLSGITGRLPEKTRENLSLIVASGKRLAGLINDILDISRLKNQDIRLSRRPVDIKALTETVLTIMRPLAAGKPIALHNRIPDDLPLVWGDENRLQQIFYNLIGNALKFTEHGQITVSAAQRNGMIECLVTDTGIGIPEELHEDIFQPFRQADASDSRAYGGAGLGLSITRHLVELHGGNIIVRSASNQGATFSFTLPVTRDPGAQRPTPEVHGEDRLNLMPAVSEELDASEPAAVLPGFDRPLRILVVDDDPVNLRVVSNHLSCVNVTVVTATSGKQAVAAVEDGLLPDLVLLDIMMPRMTGYEVLRWLRQRYTASELPVIMLTAKGAAQDVVEGFAQGANDYLVKPFHRDELLARVVSQLKLKESYLTLRENLTLRRELEERKQVERELRLMQQSLSRMLDCIDEALLAVNMEEEIAFCNRSCEGLLGYAAEDLLGVPFFRMLTSSGGEGIPEAFKEAVRRPPEGEGNRDLGTMTLKRADGTLCQVRVFVSLLKTDEDPLCLMILRGTSGGVHDEPSPGTVGKSLGIIEAINLNRSRLQSIQRTLDEILPQAHETHPDLLRELSAVDEALGHAGKTLLHGEQYESRRDLAVEVMCCALAYWTESTGLTKADLARQSKQWNVYTNLDGWERTQTLDRYLKRETLPNKPAWMKICKTVEFVLANCPRSSTLRTRLEVLLMELRTSP